MKTETIIETMSNVIILTVAQAGKTPVIEALKRVVLKLENEETETDETDAVTEAQTQPETEEQAIEKMADERQMGIADRIEKRFKEAQAVKKERPHLAENRREPLVLNVFQKHSSQESEAEKSNRDEAVRFAIEETKRNSIDCASIIVVPVPAKVARDTSDTIHRLFTYKKTSTEGVLGLLAKGCRKTIDNEIIRARTVAGLSQNPWETNGVKIVCVRHASLFDIEILSASLENLTSF